MDNQLKQIFTRRLSQCNQSGMILIMYEIYFAYIDDAKRAKSLDERDNFKIAIRKAGNTLDELIGSLDFKYELPETLYPIYTYCKRQLAKAMYEYKIDRVLETERLMKRLYEGFQQAADKDFSEPVMSNTQQIYAGMTYGRGNLVETISDYSQRGFLA